MISVGAVPDRDLRFLTPAQAADLTDGSVSLALSVSSLQEMTPIQVEGYLHLLDRLVGADGPVDTVTMRFDDQPIPARWQPTFREVAPVQTSFLQAAWSIPR